MPRDLVVGQAFLKEREDLALGGREVHLRERRARIARQHRGDAEELRAGGNAELRRGRGEALRDDARRDAERIAHELRRYTARGLGDGRRLAVAERTEAALHGWILEDEIDGLAAFATADERKLASDERSPELEERRG